MTFTVFLPRVLAVVLIFAPGCLRCYANEIGVLKANGNDGRNSPNADNVTNRTDWQNTKEGTSSVIKPRFSASSAGSSRLEFDHGLNKSDTPGGMATELRDAWRYGAIGKITLRVVDDAGNPVPNADVKGGFSVGDDKGVAFATSTDASGIAAIEGKCTADMNCRIDKHGFYRTRFVYWFPKQGYDCVKQGRWLPWNPVFEVVLKRQVHPVAMCVKSNRDGLQPPITNEFVGFDLERGAWVQPYGQGLHGDILLKYEYRAGKLPLLYYRGAVLFSFTNRFDGAYVAKKETFSAFMSAYQADTNVIYQQNLAFIYDRLSGTIVENSKLFDSEYIVLRIRSRVDATGNLVSAHYAKIYGPISAGGGGIYMNFYFNPNTNDPNLEADTSRNLLNPRDLGYPP